MKKIITKNNLLLFIITWCVLGIIGFSFLYYGPTKSYDINPNWEPIQTIEARNYTSINDCYLENNKVIITGDNPYIEFSNIDSNTVSIVCETNKLITKKSYKYFNFKYNDTYVLDECMNLYNENAKDYLCFTTKGRALTAIRLNIDNEQLELKNIKIYNKELIPVEIFINTNSFWYLIVLIIDVVLSLLITLLNRKYHFINKLKPKLKINIKNIMKRGLLLISILLLSLIIELFVSYFIIGLNSCGTYFNVSMYFFIVGILIILYLIYLIVKITDIKIEKIFLTISLSVGLVMIVAAPFGHTAADLDSHIKWVAGPSNIHGYSTEAEYSIVYNTPENQFKNTLKDNIENIRSFNDEDQYTIGTTSRQISPAHIPGAVIYAVSRLLGLPFYWKFNFVRFTYLILYTLICYFAIKILKSNKLLFSVIALFPSNIFMASSITYDWWVNAFTLFGVAKFLSENQQPHKKWKISTGLMISGSIFLACTVKMIYLPLLILPFFLKKETFKNKKISNQNRLISLFFIVLSAIWFISIFIQSTHSAGDARGGSDVNSAQQIIYVLTNPIQYSQTLINFLFKYLSITKAIEYTSQFGYLGTAQDLGVFVILTIVATVIDRNEYDKLTTTWKMRSLNIIIFIIMIVLIPTALYVSFTPVGIDKINGCQPRYIIPLLFPLLATIGTHKINNNIPPKIMKLLIFVPICFFNFWDIGTIMLTKMM